jgi:hypothetical protein
MKSIVLYLTLVVGIFSCDDSKWETINGSGISEESKNVEEAIYFEDENNGVVAGYKLLGINNVKVPVLYLTADGGNKWREIVFDSVSSESIRNAYLHKDTLICRTDSLTFFSTDQGESFQVSKDSIEQAAIQKRYLKDNKAEIKNSKFEFEGNKYWIRELYQNPFTSLIVCNDGKTLTAYYYVSFDKGKNWKFLQKDLGDNRQRFLLSDKFLYCYHFPLGLQRLNLK